MTSAPRVLGLTGSIGMGKTTTAAMFSDAGVPVWDADAVVHDLYSEDGAGVPAIAALVPNAIQNGAVHRERLREAFLEDDTLLTKVEAAIHPLVGADRRAFLTRYPTDIVLLDIPLLFETGAETICDRIAVVSAPYDVQRDRVLSRPGMTQAAFDAILARQLPDAEKRRRADYIIDTSQGLEEARRQVHTILRSLKTLREVDNA